MVNPKKAPACIQEHEIEQTIRSERLLMTQLRRLRQKQHRLNTTQEPLQRKDKQPLTPNRHRDQGFMAAWGSSQKSLHREVREHQKETLRNACLPGVLGSFGKGFF